MVVHPVSTKGTTEADGPFVQKSVTVIQASKSFPLKGEHDKVMDSHLRGSVLCVSVSYMPHIG